MSPLPTIILLVLIPQIFGAALQKPTSGRIVGGSPARAGEFPFAAAVYITKTTGRYFCAGTLMNNKNILTSGSCAENAINFEIELGVTDLSDDDHSVHLSASNFVVHGDFNADNLANDIALIHLRGPVTYTDYILPAYLPFERAADGLLVNALGWGQTSDDHAGFANDLQTVELVTITNEECAATYGNQINDNMICVVGNSVEGTCAGDMGSGLIDVTYKLFWVVGVASFVSGNGCENPDPSGYTRVFEYVDWIRDNYVQ